MKTTDLKVGDRIKVTREVVTTKTFEATVQFVGSTGITLTDGPADEQVIYVGQPGVTVEVVVPEVLPVGTVVLYLATDHIDDNLGPYVQTENGWMSLIDGLKSSDKYSHVSRPALAKAVRNGAAKIMFDPTGRL